LPSSLTTWEEAIDLRRRYPTSPAWGQAGFQGGGNVRIVGKRRGKATVGHLAMARQVADTAGVRAKWADSVSIMCWHHRRLR
jgi:hypothetical protein